MWAIIGGSGFESFQEFEVLQDLGQGTPFGETSDGLQLVRIAGQEALFLPRHGRLHEKLPSEVNYRANIWALKKNGATKIFSISAIGSLKETYRPGDAVIPSQYINRTLGKRESTFCGHGVVGHVSLAHPVSFELVEALKSVKTDFKIHFGGTYICVEGPQFSTQAESRNYISMGADIIGMTNFPEYALAREAGLGYLPIGFVTDYDCWDDRIPHVTLSGVLEIMRANRLKAFALSKMLLSQFPDIQPTSAMNAGLKTGLLTPPAQLTVAQQNWLDVLIK